MVVTILPAAQPAWAQSGADRQQEVEMALDHYTEAKTPDQRSAVTDYLGHLDRKLVAAAVIDHIIASRNGAEATAYNELLEAFAPDACTAVLDRLGKTDQATPKGKLIVALRHCQGDEPLHALTACLDDKRPVSFEAHGAHPRRVCDLAYDELFLKLRNDPRYGLDPTARMKELIGAKTPIKTRDALIAKLKSKLAAPAPSATRSSLPTCTYT